MTQQSSRAQRPGLWWAAARAHALTAATLYDLAVFPLTRSKIPALPSAHLDDTDPCSGECGALGHGVHDASSDPSQVRRLFAAAPWAAGYGIACGCVPHYLFGLDLDRKNGIDGIANFHRMATDHGFAVPRTATVVTQSGGLHLWLTAPAGVQIPNTASLLADGVDTRGSGGYLVGPGSLGPKGYYRYHPDSGPDAIAPAPAALLALLTADQGGAHSTPVPREPERTALGSPERRLDALVRFVLDCGPNDLNNRLYWAGRRAFAAPAIAPATAADRLLAAAVMRGHPEIPARRTIVSAQRGAAREVQR
ncbi:bifunctional DNA primase/polymerase [Streptomyces griseocarneus]|uniref:bifunctional DNA primase/polymerase n=1 Tax=Streptomyces griseocarneus TaxID=51201 RepID=UPI00167D572E|nr:bifunctional DNA primase/polymerase [Streptomyces griseocarneus]MBZ6477518.1 bifunctional DNA primase/polymerase [Streptomyces griseocarneus]GHG82727.1 DNA primase [Streptomyces griseocarneus]